MAESSDVTILRAAIAASGLPDRQFAARVLGVHEASLRNWLAGSRTMEEPTRRLLRLLVAHPRLIRDLDTGA